MERFEDCDEKRKQAIIYGVSSQDKDNKKVEVWLNKIIKNSDSDKLVFEAILSLLTLGMTTNWDNHKYLLSSKCEYIRGVMLMYASKVLKKGASKLLINALEDKSDVVKIYAIDELEELGDSNFIPYIKPFVESSNEDLRQSAEFALENLCD